MSNLSIDMYNFIIPYINHPRLCYLTYYPISSIEFIFEVRNKNDELVAEMIMSMDDIFHKLAIDP